MKQWYSFYAINYDATGLIEQLEKSLNVSGEKLHQVGADHQESQKLYQVSAEMAFPSIFSYVGIKVYIYWNDHMPPHLHAVYGESEVLVSIEELEILEWDIGQLHNPY